MSGPATEKFALRWNDFESNICQAFKRLKDDRDLCDVTCVCEDDQEVEAHKVVLASCSQFFDKIFKKYKNKQVVLYLKGVSCNQLKSLMSFMYLGQVSVSQEELSSFLQAAEELQVRGLAQGNTHTPGQSTHSDSKLTGRHLGDHQPHAQPSSPEVVKPEEFPEEQHDQVTQVYEEDEYADPDVFYVTGTGSGELGWDHDASNKGIVTCDCRDCLLVFFLDFIIWSAIIAKSRVALVC